MKPLLLNPKLYRGVAYALGCGSLGCGSATIKSYMNEANKYKLLDMIRAIKNSEVTLKDMWERENANKHLTIEGDHETWRLVSWLNAPKINEIAEEIIFEDVPYFWFNKKEFKNSGYKFVSWDYSNLIKDYCNKYLNMKFPRNSINLEHVRDLRSRVTAWCSVPKGYDTAKKLLRHVYDDVNGRDSHVGFFIHDVDSILREKQLYYKYNVDVSGWLWSNWPISNVLDFCTLQLRKKSNTGIPEQDLERMCMRKNKHFSKMPKLKMKRWKLREYQEDGNKSFNINFE